MPPKHYTVSLVLMENAQLLVLLLTSLPFLFLRSEWFSNSLQASLILPWNTKAYTYNG